MIDEIRERIKQYVIKKIGERIVPVLNAGFALYDLATGSAARTRMRYAIACAMLAVKGTTEEDTELAARVISKVVADEFEDKIIEALINAAPTCRQKSRPARHGEPPSDPPPKTPPTATEARCCQTSPLPSQPAPAQPAPPVHESAADAEAGAEANEYVRQKMAEAIQSATVKQPAPKAGKAPGQHDDATGQRQPSQPRHDQHRHGRHWNRRHKRRAGERQSGARRYTGSLAGAR